MSHALLFVHNPRLEFLSIYGNDIKGHLSETSAPTLRIFLAHDCPIPGILEFIFSICFI